MEVKQRNKRHHKTKKWFFSQRKTRDFCVIILWKEEGTCPFSHNVLWIFFSIRQEVNRGLKVFSHLNSVLLCKWTVRNLTGKLLVERFTTHVKIMPKSNFSGTVSNMVFLTSAKLSTTKKSDNSGGKSTHAHKKGYF